MLDAVACEAASPFSQQIFLTLTVLGHTCYRVAFTMPCSDDKLRDLSDLRELLEYYSDYNR